MSDIERALSPEIIAGQRVYTRSGLAFYDSFVLGFSARFAWKMPSRSLLGWYAEHLTDAHAEVGVGTGWFLDHARFPSPDPQLVLVDLNPNCLEVTARRVARYAPQTLRANLLEPLPWDGPPVRSVGLNYVLHCLPGPMARKEPAIAHLRAILAPGGVLFGSTLLHNGVPRNALARLLMGIYNRSGVFSNRDDDPQTLEAILRAHFDEVEVRLHGPTALFAARVASD
ncbi:MAG: class I SAM-dependent methyltransferase [Alphaproteobacteria bacterium]|nr:class I SAM-dependent methyltransferase [Alphaproteobacteria bacterium]